MKRKGGECIADYSEGDIVLQVTVQVGGGYNNIACFFAFVKREACIDL